jgi:hypothetical protein
MYVVCTEEQTVDTGMHVEPNLLETLAAVAAAVG